MRSFDVMISAVATAARSERSRFDKAAIPNQLPR